jgi:hypothetical protein
MHRLVGYLEDEVTPHEQAKTAFLINQTERDKNECRVNLLTDRLSDQFSLNQTGRKKFYE